MTERFTVESCVSEIAPRMRARHFFVRTEYGTGCFLIGLDSESPVLLVQLHPGGTAAAQVHWAEDAVYRLVMGVLP